MSSFLLKNLFVFALSLLLPNINALNRFLIGIAWTEAFIILYWATCAFLYVADHYWHGIPVENAEGALFSGKEKHRIISVVLYNQFVVTPLYMLSTTVVLPSLREYVWQPDWPLYVSIPLFILLADVAFFVLHRISHQPFLYERVHKMHHEIKHRYAAAAIHCHPVEMWCVNLLSGAVPAFLVGFDDSMILVVVAASAIDTTIAHSRWSALHFVHHKLTHLAFGTSLNLVDRLFGCDYDGEESKIAQMKEKWDGFSAILSNDFSSSKEHGFLNGLSNNADSSSSSTSSAPEQEGNDAKMCFPSWSDAQEAELTRALADLSARADSKTRTRSDLRALSNV